MIRWTTRKASVRSQMLDAAGNVVMKKDLPFPAGRSVGELSVAPPAGFYNLKDFDEGAPFF